MNIYFLILLCVVINLFLFFPVRFIPKTEKHNFTDLDVSVKWRGVFSVWVIICHFWNQVDILNQYPDLISKGFGWLLKWGANLAVGGFFFLSAYGFLKSFERKGKNYLRTYWSNKIWKIYVPFICSNICFIMLNGKLYEKYDKLWLMGGAGFYMINDTLWYIYEIAVWYFIFYILAHFWTENKVYSVAKCIILLNIFSFLALWEMNVKGVWYWTNTGISYGAICYLLCSEFIYEKLAIKNLDNKFIVVFSSIGYAVSMFITKFILKYNHISDFLRFITIFFAITSCYSFSRYFSFGNRFTRILGECSLEIYLLHASFMVYTFRIKELGIVTSFFFMIGLSIIGGISFHAIYSFFIRKIVFKDKWKK